ncbi:hypothetical protein B0H15DRAFT_995557 [Mycena belliarum]|uniref:F-box domain-containing protein n=1 Tax=Mycena belliarum TaxID=1033014 RepID=A0AAD6UFN0_9AGAR|nr:hypothetical protein B0H15DRAFT_995557 [Mycena belliae]
MFTTASQIHQRPSATLWVLVVVSDLLLPPPQTMPPKIQSTYQRKKGRALRAPPDLAERPKVQHQAMQLHTRQAKLQKQEEDVPALWQDVDRVKGPRFPLEIFSLIILSARNMKALKTFALVCHAWMSVTRSVLFREITYQDSARFAGFVYTLTSELCTVFPYVQTIGIYGSGASGGRLPMAIGWFLELIPKCVALRSMVLVSLGSSDLDKIEKYLPDNIRHNIQYLELDWNGAISEFKAFVSIFPALETLVSESRYPRPLGASLIRRSPPSSVRRLSFESTCHNCISPIVLNWFVDLHSGTIDAIDSYDIPFRNPTEFKRFLHRFGQNLDNIQLQIPDEACVGLFLDSGYCAAMPQLRSIQLDFLGYTSFLDHKSLPVKIERLPEIVASLPRSIEEITLSMDLDTIAQYESTAPEYKPGSVNWDQLDQSLSGPRYPCLRTLTIRMLRILTPRVAQEMKERWPKLLPTFARKGVLETHTSDKYYWED